MSGDRVTFFGDSMAAVVRGVDEVARLIGHQPVIIGGLAVLCRLSTPHRATVDLDVVDRRSDGVPHLEVLRSVQGAKPVEPAAVILPTPYGEVKVDVLEVRQAELDQPSADPGDRLHASAHAWASDTASALTISVRRPNGEEVEAAAPVAEPGPLVAMKLQAVMDRSAGKQGTDLLDIVRLMLDARARPRALEQIGAVGPQIAADIDAHVDHWFDTRRTSSHALVRAAGGGDISRDDMEVVAELIHEVCRRG